MKINLNNEMLPCDKGNVLESNQKITIFLNQKFKKYLVKLIN